ncbi:MAG: T9SS type A sorting domain-containing protein [Bacteroidota bacterium]
MKKTFLLFCWCLCWAQLGFGQNGFSSTLSVSFTIPDLSIDLGPNDEIEVAYQAFNNTTDVLTILPVFEILQGSEVVYDANIDLISINPEESSNGSLIIKMPDNCVLSSDDYQLRLSVTYQQNGTTAPVTVSTFDENLTTICDNLSIPIGTPGESPPCEIFLLDLTYFDPGDDCCTLDPQLTLIVTPFDLFYPPNWYSEADVVVNVSFDNDGDPIPYSLEWSNGVMEHSFVHSCGEEDYYVTITWEQNGQICTKTSETVTAVSERACLAAYEPLDPVVSYASNGSSTGGTTSPGKATSKTIGLEQVNLFPNPNTGHFHLRFSDEDQVQSVEVWNTLGQQLQQTFGPFFTTQTIELHQAHLGTYLVRIHYVNGSMAIRKFLIQ